MAKMLELQMWHFESPLRQFHRLTQEIVDKIEDKRLTIEKIRDMDYKEIGKGRRRGEEWVNRIKKIRDIGCKEIGKGRRRGEE